MTSPELSTSGSSLTERPTRELTRFTPDDDLLHDAISAAGPLARESLLLTAPIPEEKLLVFCYLWREGGTKWGRFVFVAGEDMAKPLFLSHVDDAPFEGESLRDFTLAGLHWRQPDPLKSAEVSFAESSASGTSIGAGDGLELEIRFDGIHEPFSWHDNADGCPDWVAPDRYEQSGVTRGKLTLTSADARSAGAPLVRTVEFTGAGHRDHSWGTRDWNYLQHWKWMNAATPDGAASLHCMLMSVKGETLVNGYINTAGAVSPIVDGKATADLDDQMIHRAISGVFHDELGREMRLEARYAAGWSMPIQHLLLNEIGMTATLDDAPATAHIELGWPAGYVENLTR